MMRRRLLLFLAATIAVSASAQQHPNQEKGFHPDKVYQIGNLDAINIFNGNLNVTLPIGGSYPVNGDLEYGLTLSYSGNTWDYETYYHQGEVEVTDARPYEHANAGIGWVLTLGKLVERDPPSVIVYLAPDSSEHRLGPKFDKHSSEPAEPGVYYSRDGSYLRLQDRSVLDPNYHPATSTRWWLEKPDGQIHEFDESGNMVRIRDRHGNTISVSSLTTTNPIYISDPHGRSQEIYFKESGTESGIVVDRVVLTAPGATSATYLFNYEYKTISKPDGVQGESAVGSSAYVALLSSINLPNGSSFQMAYFEGDGLSLDPRTGHLRTLVLPTLGSLEWSYEQRQYPTSSIDPSCNRPEILPQPKLPCIGYLPHTRKSLAVSKKELLSSIGTILSTWTYNASCGDVAGDCNSSPELRVNVTGPLGHRSEHFFSTYSWGHEVESTKGWKAEEYSAPFTRNEDDRRFSTQGSPRYLSSRVYDSGGRHLRSTYVRYEGELKEKFRLVSSRTVYHDDGNRFVDKDYSEFDGLGHYRRTEVKPSWGGIQSRMMYTDYHADRGTYTIDPTTNELTTAYVQPDLSMLWVLGRHSTSTIQEGTRSLHTERYFDPDTGFFRRERILSGTTRSGNDLLTIYTPDANGNTATVEYFGNDLYAEDVNAGAVALGTGSLPSLTIPPHNSYSYKIINEYSFGSLSKSRYDGHTHYNYDATIDQSTGLPISTRDVSGIQTTLAYDSSRRLKEVRPTGAAWTESTYQNAAATTPASVSVIQRPEGTTTASSPLTESRFEFDSLGRLRDSKSHRLVDGSLQWVTTRTEYDAAGHAQKQFQPTTGTPAHFTLFESYDPFSRAAKVTAPDGSITTISYLGSRVQTSNRFVATGINVQTSASVTETYDGFGRLEKVEEMGGTSTTEYGYDPADRLIRVEMTAPGGSGAAVTQTRVFDYDGRGFLLSETHPESGTMIYAGYDARGHLRRERFPDDLFDKNHVYDSAERLIATTMRNPNYATNGTGLEFHPAREYVYSSANSVGNLSKGKLSEARRYNRDPNLGYWVAQEFYTYGDAAGRLTRKDLHFGEWRELTGVPRAPILSTTQSRVFDDLGQVVDESYPDCVIGDCFTGANDFVQIDRSYSRGQLISVGRDQITNDVIANLQYGASGQVTRIDHANGVSEIRLADPHGLSRPAAITFDQWTPCMPPTINQHPQNTVVPANSSATLSVTATGMNLQYQWYSGESGQKFDGSGNSTAIPGATSSTFVTPLISATKRYWVHVYSTCGQTGSSGNVAGMGIGPNAAASAGVGVYSYAAVVSPDSCPTLQIVSAAPTINPIPTIEAVDLWVETGEPGDRFQWYRGSSGDTSLPVTGATGARYLVPPGSTNESYWVRVSNACSSINSQTFTVDRCGLPIFTDQPDSVAIQQGQGTTLSVQVTGKTPLSFQWYQGKRGDTSVSLGTGTSYSTGALTTTKSYWVKVTNSCGETWSDTATVEVCEPPVVLTQPAPATVPVGGTATIQVEAGGTEPLFYQWYQGSSGERTIPVTGATSNRVTIGDVNTPTSYWVAVTNACSTLETESAAATIDTCNPPAVSQWPPSETNIQPGGSVTLSVSATGGTGLGYQWYIGYSGDRSQRISGATAASYTTPGLQSSEVYWVEVKDDCSAVASPSLGVYVGDWPTNVVATAGSQTSVTVSWTAATGAVQHYEIQKFVPGSGFSTITTVTSTSYSDAVTASGAWAYRVRAAFTSGVMSGWSNVDVATTYFFSDDPAAASVTPVRAAHLQELRAAIDGFRSTVGRGIFTWTDAAVAGNAVRAVHVTEMRQALNEALITLGAPLPAYSSSPIAQGAIIRASDWQEIREAMK